MIPIASRSVDLVAPKRLRACWSAFALLGSLATGAHAFQGPADEALIFTPPGFASAGQPATLEAGAPGAALLRVVVLDAATGKPTACRINVVGPDGRFYQPAPGRLTPYSLTGEWPRVGKGNRQGKAPIRYLGRYFYSTGESEVWAPAGRVRVEAWKGLEFRPAFLELDLAEGETRAASLTLERTVDMAALGYESGDSHLHLERRDDADDALIFDLLEAEDVRFGALLGYNEPAGPYKAVREILDYPQLRGLGSKSERSRGRYSIMSGQEYRSGVYGHLNLFYRDDLVREGEAYNADHWPPYGQVGRETRARGGSAIYAHGGYAQSIYSDFVKGDVQAVELLQFGVYRGITLEDWYRILNIGYRFPAVGASDFPACRKLADCVSYVKPDPAAASEGRGWIAGAVAGRGFVTSGPLLLLDLDGAGPGDLIAMKGPGPHRIKARVRAYSNVAPIGNLQLIVNGKVVSERPVPADHGLNAWSELEVPLELSASSWVAARAYGTASTGSPDAEAHTNPVYVHLDERAPFDRESLDRLVEKLDAQVAIHRGRDFPDKARVLDEFQSSRDVLLKIRQNGGFPSSGVPGAWIDEAVAGVGSKAALESDAELAEFLRPVPPKAAAEMAGTFETAPGYRMELLASEPLLRSPVAAAYDERGNLYVAEMTDYPYKPKPGGTPLGSIRLLRDTDGDGRLDSADVFADGLLWAAGVAPWKGGVFVAAPPDIWYMKDTDGDRKADLKRKVFTGFGTENEQGMLNNLTFGVDHKIYGSTSVNGGVVRHAERPDDPGVSVKGRDFRFDPETEVFEVISGTVQFGTTFDDLGNRFLCSESRPLLQAVLPLEALARNPHLPVASALQDIAGGPVPIDRISPPERWRQIRSSRRIATGERSASAAGASHHVVDAAAGVTVYRGAAYPAADYGQVFVCDAQNNLIHRMRLIPDGATFRAERVDAKGEFVRSYDSWFRPVNLLNAPDGTLHVLDMSREVIEAIHIPLDVVKHLDLRRGRDLGRLWRVAPDGFQPPPLPDLDGASTARLVETLGHPSAWWRETAHRLLHERGDAAAAGPLRSLLARRDASPVSRGLALWSLSGLGVLTDEDLIGALGDASPAVVEQALKLAGPRLGGSPALLDAAAGLAGHPDARVRFGLALALGASGDPKAVAALARIAVRDAADRWTGLAVLCAAGTTSGPLLAEVLATGDPSSNVALMNMLGSMAGVVGVRNDAAEVRQTLEVLAGADAGVSRPLFAALAQGLKRGGGRFEGPEGGRSASAGRRFLAAQIHRATRLVLDPDADESARIESAALLGTTPLADALGPLESLLDLRASGPVQVAAVRALAGFPDAEVATLLLGRMDRVGPAARAEILNALLARPAWTRAMLLAAEAGTLDLAGIDPARRPLLIGHKDPEIARLARGLLGETRATPGGDLMAAFRSTPNLKGDPGRGGEVFGRLCSTCHKVGNAGHAVGPDLGTSQFSEPQALLTHIVEPNRYVAPNYVQYVVADRSGKVYSGLIASETASSITLRGADGVEETLLRSQVEELTSTGKSLMPEDLASKLTPQEAADLIAYILETRPAAAGAGRPDVGTLPGAVEPD